MSSSFCLSHDDISHYVRGATPAARVPPIVRHVERCDACHDRVVAMIRAARAPPAPTTAEAWLAARRRR
jgi:anti-sigma factor RsiW